MGPGLPLPAVGRRGRRGRKAGCGAAALAALLALACLLRRLPGACFSLEGIDLRFWRRPPPPPEPSVLDRAVAAIAKTFPDVLAEPLIQELSWLNSTISKGLPDVPQVLADGVPTEVLGPASCVAIVLLAVYVRHKVQERRLNRPYEIRDLNRCFLNDPEGEFRAIVNFLQDVIMMPIDVRLPGRPFEFDFHSFPFSPMVLVLGNHSSGKSTFINRLIGTDVQDTGVAPTDDGFTVLERTDITPGNEDGPTVLGCPQNVCFKELQRFGQIFSGHLKRKRLKLPESSSLPRGLQIVDTPGMIDLPVASSNNVRGRGYNFVEVVRWWAKRADLVLLLFDPDKPGTTGETLDVLTKSLSGLNHKFLVVLNKVDKLDNSVDFARAYGALGWALSKVIHRKDIPQIYTMYNDGFEAPGKHKLPLESFAKKRKEVVDEVLRVKDRHNDNIITALEETLRQMEMISTIISFARIRGLRKQRQMRWFGILLLGAPLYVAIRLYVSEVVTVPDWAVPTVLGVYSVVCLVVIVFLSEYFKQWQRLEVMNLDRTFEIAYARFFIHDDGEDFRARWTVVQPKVIAIITSVGSLVRLPVVPRWEIDRIWDVLGKDIWYLRQVARQLRKPTERDVGYDVPKPKLDWSTS